MIIAIMICTDRDYDMHGISRKIITELANLKINL